MATLRIEQMVRFAEDYQTKFDAVKYLHSFEKSSFRHQVRCFLLRELHKLYEKLDVQPASLAVLDIGTGPCIVYSISIAPYASQIVLAEYAAVNRAMLTSWLQNQGDAYDWTPYFTQIVTEMEGKDEMEVAKREAMVREKVKAVVPCDITKDPPIPQEHICQYDIIQSFLCLESACATKEDFSAAIARMASLLKAGGKIVLYFVEWDEAEENACYRVGPEVFFDLPISKTFVLSTIEHAGFYDVTLATLSREQLGDSRSTLYGFHFLTATRKEESTT